MGRLAFADKHQNRAAWRPPVNLLSTRRDFLRLSSALSFAAAITPVAPVFAQSTRDSGAEALYRKAFVLDCNTLANIGTGIGDGDVAQLRLLRESGVTAVKASITAPGVKFEETVAEIAAAQSLIERHPETFIKLTRFEDLDRARREHKMAVIFSFENATMLEDKVDRIDLFRQLGVRVMQLSYNHASPFGSGCLDGEDGGLTDLGRQAVARMNALGVALDLSHSNTRTTADGIAASTRPPIFSHSACRAVYRHPRSKEDREMKALADKGGVMGIFMLPYLTEESRQPMLDDYIQHMVHALDVCGEEHVGIGSDVSFFTVDDETKRAMAEEIKQRQAAGISAPGENRMPYIPDLDTPRKLELVAGALLKRCYGSRVVENALGLNFRRVFKEIWAV